MRTFLYNIKADLANCTDLRPLDTEAYPHDYGFTLECFRCGYQHPKEVSINRYDVIEIEAHPGSKQKNPRLKGRNVNFHTKCKDCHNPIFIILENTSKALTTSSLQSQSWVPILEIHAHGCNITSIILEDQYVCKSLSGEVFEEVDLRGGEWTEFDEKNNKPMTVSNFRFELEEKRGNAPVTSL